MDFTTRHRITPPGPRLRVVTGWGTGLGRSSGQNPDSNLISGPVFDVCMILYYTILYTILYYTILCYAMLCYAMLCYAMLYHTILYYTILYYTILYDTLYIAIAIKLHQRVPGLPSHGPFDVCRSQRRRGACHELRCPGLGFRV